MAVTAPTSMIVLIMLICERCRSRSAAGMATRIAMNGAHALQRIPLLRDRSSGAVLLRDRRFLGSLHQDGLTGKVQEDSAQDQERE